MDLVKFVCMTSRRECLMSKAESFASVAPLGNIMERRGKYNKECERRFLVFDVFFGFVLLNALRADNPT